MMETRLLIKYSPLLQINDISVQEFGTIHDNEKIRKIIEQMSSDALPPKSASQCRELLRPISPARGIRNVNGDFIPTSRPEKYELTIHCEDIHSPVLDAITIGNILQVGCLTYMWKYIDNQNFIDLPRLPVEESIEITESSGKSVTMQVEGAKISFGDEPVTGYLRYRPWMTVFVRDFKLQKDEWTKHGSWVIEMEEI